MNALTTNWALVRASLADERARKAIRIDVDETEFLPAALEVIERPASPTARLTARVMFVGLGVMALWLVFGRTEIVASAPGKIIPAGNVQLVQPADSGVVRRILVHEGDSVQRNQPLIVLDPTISAAEATQATRALETVSFDAARLHAVIGALDGKGFVFAPPAGSDPAMIEGQRALAHAKLTEVETQIRSQASSGGVANADIAAAQAQVDKLTQTLPLLDQQIAANEQLLEKGFVSKLKVIEMRRQRIGQARDRDAALAQIQRARAQAGAVGSGTAAARAQARAELMDQLVKAEADMRLRQEEVVKSQQHMRMQVLRAPIAGRVGQLSVHTEGGVVEAAKPIMTIVPDRGRLIAEVKMLNSDAGFVAPGQKVQVKLDAFPFSRFGAVTGKVIGIAPDAIEDEKLGLVYMVRVSLDRVQISRGDVTVPVVPGMKATADIITGSRSYLSYLTSPIETARGTALHER